MDKKIFLAITILLIVPSAFALVKIGGTGTTYTNWNLLTNFPTGCPSGYAVTTIDLVPTCIITPLACDDNQLLDGGGTCYDINSISSGVLQSPWTQNINANGYSVYNAGDGNFNRLFDNNYAVCNESGNCGSAGQLVYYFKDDASDVGGDKQQTIAPLDTETFVTGSSLASGSTLVQTWATNPNIPNLPFLPAGQYDCHMHLEAGTIGGKDVHAYCEIWEVDASGVDVALIGTTGLTPIIGTKSERQVSFNDVNTYLLASTSSRIATKVYAFVSGAGVAPDLNIYYGDGSDSHTALPSNSVDASNFVSYTGVTQDLNVANHNFLDLNSITYGGFSIIDFALKVLYGDWNIGGNLYVNGTNGITLTNGSSYGVVRLSPDGHWAWGNRNFTDTNMFLDNRGGSGPFWSIDPNYREVWAHPANDASPHIKVFNWYYGYLDLSGNDINNANDINSTLLKGDTV